VLYSSARCFTSHGSSWRKRAGKKKKEKGKKKKRGSGRSSDRPVLRFVKSGFGNYFWGKKKKRGRQKGIRGKKKKKKK